MPTLDFCISSVYEDGNIPADHGQDPVPVVAGSLLDPDDYDPDSIEYSLNHTRFYNSMYLIGFIF
jgi:hypothetical protein